MPYGLPTDTRDNMCTEQITMKLEFVILTLWYLLIDDSEAKGYCTFPKFLWEPMADGSERKWLGRTEYYLNTETWTTQKEIIAYGTEIIIRQKTPCSSHHSHVRRDHTRHSRRRTAREDKVPCYRPELELHIICISEEPDSKFRVQQSGNGPSLFSCLRFYQRNTNVVQIYQAVGKEVNEDRLCYDQSLQRNEWPWIAFKQQSWSYCPMEGGFDFTPFYGFKRKRMCEDEWRPSRFESECVRGEGAVFYFPQPDCSPFMDHRTEQPLHCWASWEESNYKFVLFGEEEKQPRYVLRLPQKVNIYDEFTAHLYLSPVMPITQQGEPPGEVAFIEMLMLRSEPGVCYDESDLCRQYALEGRCTNSALHRYANYCKRSCGVCDFAPSPRAECKFPDEFMGDWVLFNEKEREEITIDTGSVRFSTLGRLICKSKHWEDDFYKVFSVFNNGCRPRYSCIELSPGVGKTLDFRLSRSDPSDRSFHLCHFADDLLPLGSLIRSLDTKMLLPMSTMFFGGCGLGGLARAEVTFSDGRRCDGTLWDVNLATCDPRSKMMLNLPSCERKRLGFLCSAFIRLPDGNSFLATHVENKKDKFACWVISERHEKMTLKTDNLPLIEFQRAHCDSRHPLFPSKVSRELVTMKLHRDLLDSSCGQFQKEAKDDAHHAMVSAVLPPSTKAPPTSTVVYQQAPPFSKYDTVEPEHKYFEKVQAYGSVYDVDDGEDDSDKEGGYIVYDTDRLDDSDYLVLEKNHTAKPSRTRKHEYMGSRHVGSLASNNSCFLVTILISLVSLLTR